MNTISCKKNENPLNETQDNHFLQCVEFTTEQKFAITSEKKETLTNAQSWRAWPFDIRYSYCCLLEYQKTFTTHPR